VRVRDLESGEGRVVQASGGVALLSGRDTAGD
jgi:hypothetical protein